MTARLSRGRLFGATAGGEGDYPMQTARRGRPRKQLQTVDQLAAYLNVGRTTLYALLDDGLPYLRVGYQRRFDLDEVLRWLRRRTRQRQSDGYE